MAKGFAFSPDTFQQQEFESSFQYYETPDQIKAVEAVKKDMESDCPMDRLVCGDVGFGKTEVAMRAAFKAVADNKQVAVLVPTTILALQHYNTFRDRLRNFPCTIDYLSRLRTSKEVADITERLKNGKIDIIIGTHRLLGKNIAFKDLGLLIIDEEQKFGVAAKETLRRLKLSVDTLTLTATPIPRTLQFSLLGARDLSIINTPPPNRLPIQTEIIDFNEDTIRDIINEETGRGGQVFFVHNRVQDIYEVEDIIRRIVPGIKTCVAHGQMEPKVLENKDAFVSEITDSVMTSLEGIENIVADKVGENLLLATQGDGETAFDEIIYNTSADILSALSGEGGKEYPGLSAYQENTVNAVERLVYEVLSRLDLSAYNITVPENVIGGNPVFGEPDPNADYSTVRNNIRRSEVDRILSSLL